MALGGFFYYIALAEKSSGITFGVNPSLVEIKDKIPSETGHN